MLDKNKNLLSVLLGVIILMSAIYFFTREGDVKKEEIKIDNVNSINKYEKENNANVGGISASNNNTSNNSQNNVATNTQEKIVSSTTVKNLEVSKNINIINNKMRTAIIKTNMGEIEVELNMETTPNTAENFAKLASSGFYDGVRFHRVIKDFMIQTGDPQSKDLSKKGLWGTGGPGYKFADELKGTEKYPVGTLAMANSGPNTNGSQFFIVTAQPGYPLPPLYTVFGKVTKGLDNALKINEIQTDGSDRPLKDVIIESVMMK